jgi:Ca2+-binding EF-hand superfamily protein
MKKLLQNKVAWMGLALVATIPAFANIKYQVFDRVKQYDFDKDGKVSFEDINRYCTVPKQLFDHADKNGDGYLNNSELRTAREYLLSRCGEVPK